MICDECGKNKATVHLTEIIDEQIKKLNLCEACAKEKGSDVEQHFGIADLLAALSDTEKVSAVPGASQAPLTKIRCPQCGMTYEDFKKIGRLGCGDCYTAFKNSLAPLLKRIHGSAEHMGKAPDPVAMKEQKVSSKLQEEIQQAKELLQKSIKKEEFEEAAALRDKINFLEKKLREKKDTGRSKNET